MKIAGHTMGTPELTVKEAARLFAEAGMDAIEIIYQDGYQCAIHSDTTEEELKELKGFLGELKLEVSCIVSYASDYNQPDREKRYQAMEECRCCIKVARILGASFIRIYGGTFLEGDRGFDEKRHILVDTMRKLADEAAESGISLVLENHFNTMTTGPQITCEIVREIDRDNVGILYDQANIGFLSGEDYKDCIRIQKDKIYYVHVKDFKFKSEGMKFRADSVSHVDEDARAVVTRIVGEGILPWPEIIGELHRIGYDGYLSLEYERRWHPMDIPEAAVGMTASASYVRTILEGFQERKSPVVINFGSLNLDYTYHLPHVVAEGETISSKELEIHPGGKGLNQSIALARAGATVYHAGLTGGDGVWLKGLCEDCGIHADYVECCDTRTGNAIIQVDDAGNNCIILFPGANHAITEEMADRVLAQFDRKDILLLQNEINDVDRIIDKASQKGMRIVLNPSPCDEAVIAWDLSGVSLLILNEVEGAQLTGTDDEEQMIHSLTGRYKDMEIVLTLGKRGAWFADQSQKVFQPAYPVEAVDTTGAGDTFTGYFVREYLINGKQPQDALKTAAAASALAVQRWGASSSVPGADEVRQALIKFGETV